MKTTPGISPHPATSDSDDAVVREERDELDHSADEDQFSEQNKTSERKPKRSRASGTKPKAPRKRYVRGKQGGLQGIMKMPLEIFTEIASHIAPGDLIALIWTSKFFRQMLMRRSASPIWQRAQSNIVGLPPCPTGMSEPQYAALLFSKTCTLCGGAATAQPDPYLRVRLCASCRDTKLEEAVPSYNSPRIDYRCVAKSEVIKPKAKPQFKFPSGKACYCLREEVDKVAHRRAELLRDGNAAELRTWEQELRGTIEAQAQEARQIQSYLGSATLSWSTELQRVKQERRDTIHKRLIELGWEEKEFYFHDEDAKPWKALVEAPKPLTERVWTNMLPKLIPLLEENRARIQESEKRRRRYARRIKLNDLLCKIKRETHPYSALLDALSTGPPDNTNISSSARICCPNPFPETILALQWDFLKDLYEEEHSLEQLEELFNERRAQLDQKVDEWRADIESQLVEQYGAKFESEGDNDMALKIRGSADSTQHLSRNTRFLLRADTILVRKGDRANPPNLYHFPDIASSWDEDFEYWDCSLSTPSIQPDQYLRNSEMETITKGVLKGMGIPDVAYVELASMGRVFVCGRCPDNKPKRWNDMLLHYRDQIKQQNGFRPLPKTRNPIVFRNIHDMDPTISPKPLVRILSNEEADSMAVLTNQDAETLSCRLCSAAWTSYWGSQGQIWVHLEDVHEVVNPVQDVHYKIGHHFGLFFGSEEAEWCDRWDAHYDAQLSNDGAQGQSAESSSATTAASG